MSRIYLRDLVTKQTTLLSDAYYGDATAPSISADGGLVSFEQDGNIYVAVRTAGTGGKPATWADHLVTSSTEDPRYAHVTACPAELGGTTAARVTPCGPRLSADGSTLAYEAERTPISPDLSVSVTPKEEGGKPRAHAEATLRGDVIDFSPVDEDVISEPYQTLIVTYTNEGDSPLTFPKGTGLSVGQPTGAGESDPFELLGSTCSGVLYTDWTCQASLGFDSGVCFTSPYLGTTTLLTGELLTNATTPAGQSSLSLSALCDSYDSDGPRAGTHTHRPADQGRGTAQPSCPAAPAGLSLVAAPGAATDNQEAPLTDSGEVQTGRPYVEWMTVQAPLSASDVTGTLTFAAANDSDCQIQLVNPAGMDLSDPLPKGAPAACYNGEPLLSVTSNPGGMSGAGKARTAKTRTAADGTAQLSCTAYLLITPTAATPDTALLGLSYSISGTIQVSPLTYLTEQGTSQVIVASRDPSGAGTFGSNPAKVVSVTSAGTTIPDASEPSVSTTGQYIAFTAPVPETSSGPRVPGVRVRAAQGSLSQQDAAGATQVWLRNTGKKASTTLVSCLPQSSAGTCTTPPDADSGSVSGTGQAVAFATSTAPAGPRNGWTGQHKASTKVKTTALVKTGAAAATVSADQVYVRSPGTNATTLISAPPTSAGSRARAGRSAAATASGGNGASFAPAISQDGAAVAFVSQATNLTSATVPAQAMNLYLRPAAGGAAPSELVSASGTSLAAGTRIGVPSLDAHGRQAAFPATGKLVPGLQTGSVDVYTFERKSALQAAPGVAAFGPLLEDSGTYSRTLTFTNSGPGPGTVTAVSQSSPFDLSTDTCNGQVVYSGAQCTVTVTFTPVSPGQDDGTLKVTTTDDGEAPVTVPVSVTATVPSPDLAASPDVASAGETAQVNGSWFPPSQLVTLDWNPGLGSVTVHTSKRGTFRTDMVIFPNDIVGPRVLLAGFASTPRQAALAGAGATGLASESFLVQPNSVEPPFTSKGN